MVTNRLMTKISGVLELESDSMVNTAENSGLATISRELRCI